MNETAQADCGLTVAKSAQMLHGQHIAWIHGCDGDCPCRAEWDAVLDDQAWRRG